MSLHELSIAEAILEFVQNYEVEKGKKLKRVVVGVGQLTQLDIDLLKDNLKALSEAYGLTHISFLIKVEKTLFKCNVCGFKWSWDEIGTRILKDLCGEERECDNPIHYIPALANVFIKCPECESLDFTIESGKGVKVIEVEFY